MNKYMKLITQRASSGIAAGRCRREKRNESINETNQLMRLNELFHLIEWFDWVELLMNGARPAPAKQPIKLIFNLFDWLFAAANGIHEVGFGLVVFWVGYGPAPAPWLRPKKTNPNKQTQQMNEIEK